MEVIVYSGTDCPKCDTLKNKLKALNVVYSEINIREDEEAANLLRSKGYRGIPVVCVDGEFEKDAMGWVKSL